MPSDILIQLKDSSGDLLYPKIKTSNLINDGGLASNSYVQAGLALKLDLPENTGVEGQVLLKTSTGTQWADYTPQAQGVDSWLPFSEVTDSVVTFAVSSTPVGVLTDKANYYPVQKGTVWFDSDSTVSLDVTPYLAYDGSASFTGTWRCYFAGGGSTQPGTSLTKAFISQNTNARSGYWYLCSADLNVILPVVTVAGKSVKVSTLKGVDNVLITPSGSQIQSDSSFLLDTANTAVELTWDGTQWKVAEVIVN